MASRKWNSIDPANAGELTDEQLDIALSKFESDAVFVRCEDGECTTQFDARDGFWNPKEDKYVEPKT